MLWNTKWEAWSLSAISLKLKANGIPGDLNSDGKVNIFDASILSSTGIVQPHRPTISATTEELISLTPQCCSLTGLVDTVPSLFKQLLKPGTNPYLIFYFL